MKIRRTKTILALAFVLTLGWSTCVPQTPASDSPTSTARPVAPLATALRQAQGIAYYVRSDGGSSDQCTGQANAPYPGSGAAQPCAWDHPCRSSCGRSKSMA